jgi:hypothetical protein
MAGEVERTLLITCDSSNPPPQCCQDFFGFTVSFLRPGPESEDASGFGPERDRVAAPGPSNGI